MTLPNPHLKTFSGATWKNKRFIQLIGLGLVYYLAVNIGLSFVTKPEGISVIWPASGVALAALLMSPRREWFSILAVVFFTNLISNLISGVSLPPSAGFAFANTLEPALGGLLMRHWLGDESITFTKLVDFLSLTAVAVLVNGFTAFIGALVPMLAFGSSYTVTWLSWWILDGMSILIVTPFLITWATTLPLEKNTRSERRVETLIWLIVLTATTWVMFGAKRFDIYLEQNPYMLFPILVWVALRFSPRASASALVLTSIIALYSATLSTGHFPIGGSSPREKLISIQAFLSVASVTTMMLSATFTERKQTVKALSESEARFRLLAENSTDMISRHDEHAIFLYVSPACRRLLGYEPEELIGHSSFEFIHPDDIPAVSNSRSSIFDKPIVSTTVFRIRRKDGEYIWMETTSHAITENTPDGKPEIHAASRDVTQRKLSEDALRDSEEGLNEAQRLTHIGNWQWTIATDTVKWSEELYRINQRDPSLPAPSYAELASFYTTESWVRLNESVTKAVQSGDPYELYLDIVQPNGVIRHTFSRGEADYDANGGLTGLHGTVQDITERIQAERHIQRHLEHLNALHNIDTAIKSNNNIRTTLRIFLEEVSAQLRPDAIDILLFNNNTLMLDYAASRGFRSAVPQSSNLRPGEGYASQVILDRKMIHIPDLSHMENKLSEVTFLAGEKFAAYIGCPLIAKGQVVGVLEIYQRAPFAPDPDWFDFLYMLADQAAIAIDNAQLFESLQRTNFDLILAYDATIEGWSHALDLRDRETEGHTQRVTALTLNLAQQLGVPETQLVHIRRGALLHDIGKMGIPDSILLKPGKLTPEEWDVMHQHTLYANEMLLPIQYLKPALDIPCYHHEKWDGSGYPYKLKGEEIPFAARIFAAVDVWDAITNDRPYRSHWSRDKALQYIETESGKHFDPKVAKAFLKMLQDHENSGM